MGHFKAAHFALFEASGSLPLTGARMGRFVTPAPAVISHAAQHGFVAGHRSELRRLLDPGRQIVVVELDVPLRMFGVLGF